MVFVGECAQKAAGSSCETGVEKDERFCLHKKEQGFKRSERIKAELVFKRLYREGRYFKTNNFSLRVLPNDINILRLGISVQASVFPKATQRNRIKRLIREVFRRNKAILNKGCDIVVKPGKPEIAKIEYKELEKEILGLFEAAGVLKKI